MTVKELMEALKEFDENVEVLGYVAYRQDPVLLNSVTPYVGMDNVTVYPSLNLEIDTREL